MKSFFEIKVQKVKLLILRNNKCIITGNEGRTCIGYMRDTALFLCVKIQKEAPTARALHLVQELQTPGPPNPTPKVQHNHLLNPRKQQGTPNVEKLICKHQKNVQK